MFLFLRRIGSFLTTPWWRAVLLWVVALVLFFVELWWSFDFAFLIGFFIYALVLILFSARCVYSVYHRRWKQGIIHLLLFVAATTVLLVWMMATAFVRQAKGDQFAKHLKVPEHIQLETLYSDGYLSGETNWVDSLRALPHTSPHFYLYESGQPGLFQFDAWIGKLDSGTLYFKAFEITQNTPLSEERLVTNSALPVCNTSDSIRLFSSKHTFTIYEGDWGEPYAARFELWYKPLSGSPEQKLLSKNYLIEGWQR